MGVMLWFLGTHQRFLGFLQVSYYKGPWALEWHPPFFLGVNTFCSLAQDFYMDPKWYFKVVFWNSFFLNIFIILELITHNWKGLWWSLFMDQIQQGIKQALDHWKSSNTIWGCEMLWYCMISQISEDKQDQDLDSGPPRKTLQRKGLALKSPHWDIINRCDLIAHTYI